MKKPERQKQPKIKKQRQVTTILQSCKKSAAEKLSPNLLYNQEFSNGSGMSYFICQLDWTNGFQIPGKKKIKQRNKKTNKKPTLDESERD